MARQTEAQKKKAAAARKKKADEAKQAEEAVEVKDQEEEVLTDSAMDDQMKALEEGQPVDVPPEPEKKKDGHQVISMSSHSVKQTLENPFYFMNMGQLRRYAKAIGVGRVRDVGRFGLIHKIVAQAKKKNINMLRTSAAKDIEKEVEKKMEQRALLPGETIRNPKNLTMSHALSEEEYQQRLAQAEEAEPKAQDQEKPTGQEPSNEGE